LTRLFQIDCTYYKVQGMNWSHDKRLCLRYCLM